MHLFITPTRLGFFPRRKYLFKIKHCASLLIANRYVYIISGIVTQKPHQGSINKVLLLLFLFCKCCLTLRDLFFFCPRYAAQSNVILTSAASSLGEMLSLSSNARNINYLLCWALQICAKYFGQCLKLVKLHTQPVDLNLEKCLIYLSNSLLLCDNANKEYQL